MLTPCAESESAALATMAPTTAMSAHGTRLTSLPPSTITASTTADTASVVMLVWPRSPIQLRNSATAPLPAFA